MLEHVVDWKHPSPAKRHKASRGPLIACRRRAKITAIGFISVPMSNRSSELLLRRFVRKVPTSRLGEYTHQSRADSRGGLISSLRQAKFSREFSPPKLGDITVDQNEVGCPLKIKARALEQEPSLRSRSVGAVAYLQTLTCAC